MMEQLIFSLLIEWQDYYNISLSDRVKKTYLGFFKNVPDGLKEQICKSVYKSCEFMPRIAKLNEIVQPIMFHNKPDKVVNEKQCWYCMDKGLIPYEREGHKYVAYCPHCAVGGKYAKTIGLKNAEEIFGDKLRDVVAKRNYQNYNGVTADHEKEIDKNRHFCSGAVECEQEKLCK